MEDSIIDKIKAGSQHYELFDWPNVGQVGMRLLNEQDIMEASKDASNFFKDIPLTAGNIVDFESEKSTQQLYRCIVNPDTKKQLFMSILDFRRVLTPEIKEILDEKLDEIHEKYSPNINVMSDNELDKYVDELKKNSNQKIGNISSLHVAKQLITYLVNQLTN